MRGDGLIDLEAVAVRSYIAEPERGQRHWTKRPEAQRAVYHNRRRVRGARGQRLMRRRGMYVERAFAHLYDTGGMRARDAARAARTPVRPRRSSNRLPNFR